MVAGRRCNKVQFHLGLLREGESLDGDKTVCLRVSDHHPPSLLTFVGVEGSNNW